MPVGRFKTYQKKGSFGSLFFGLFFLMQQQSPPPKTQRFAKRPLRYLCVVRFFSRHAPSFLVWGILERKVAEVRKATTPLLLQQGSDFLIRRCKALRQTSRSQVSFHLRGQNEGAEVVGRTKLADRTTFKQI